MVEAYLFRGAKKAGRKGAVRNQAAAPVSEGRGTMEDLARALGATIPKKTAGAKRG
jgi:hypothetical protein